MFPDFPVKVAMLRTVQTKTDRYIYFSSFCTPSRVWKEHHTTSRLHCPCEFSGSCLNTRPFSCSFSDFLHCL